LFGNGEQGAWWSDLAQKYRLQLFGTSRGVRDTPANTYAAPNTSVITSAMDITQAVIADEMIGRFNGAVVAMADTLSPAGTGNFGNFSLNVGARSSGTLFFSGRIYGLIVRNAVTNANDISMTEKWMGSKCGQFF
jgi:hypothetical protein